MAGETALVFPGFASASFFQGERFFRRNCSSSGAVLPPISLSENWLIIHKNQLNAAV
jgi:hypothetical protein